LTIFISDKILPLVDGPLAHKDGFFRLAIVKHSKRFIGTLQINGGVAMKDAYSALARWTRRIATFILFAYPYTFSGPVHAINCSPQALVGNAVAGEIVNGLLGQFSDIPGAAGGVNNFVSPTLSSVIGPCILDPINGRPPADRLPPGGPILGPPAGGWGDPHMVTHDGLGYGFQAAGDYAYVESDNLLVHARQFRLSVNASVSRINAYAIRFNETTIVINDPLDTSIIGSENGLTDIINVNGIDMPIGLQRCLDVGVLPGFALHGCTYDMVFDEDEQWLADAVEIAANGWSTVPASALVAPSGDAIELDINASVFAMQPAPGSGVLSTAFEVDRYSLTTTAGTERLLQVNEPCSNTQPFSVLLEYNGVRAQEFSLQCNSVTDLPTGFISLTVFSNAGDTGNYSFSLVEPASTELDVIALNTRITGSITANERLIATLPSQPGDKVFIASDQNQNCNQRWKLLDSTSDVIKGSRTCIDMGLVTMGDNTPYSLEIQGKTATTYNFTVLSVGADDTGETDTNQPFQLTVSTPGQEASVTFELDAGDRIYVDREAGVLSGTLVVSVTPIQLRCSEATRLVKMCSSRRKPAEPIL